MGSVHIITTGWPKWPKDGWKVIWAEEQCAKYNNKDTVCLILGRIHSNLPLLCLLVQPETERRAKWDPGAETFLTFHGCVCPSSSRMRFTFQFSGCLSSQKCATVFLFQQTCALCTVHCTLPDMCTLNMCSALPAKTDRIQFFKISNGWSAIHVFLLHMSLHVLSSIVSRVILSIVRFPDPPYVTTWLYWALLNEQQSPSFLSCQFGRLTQPCLALFTTRPRLTMPRIGEELTIGGFLTFQQILHF